MGTKGSLKSSSFNVKLTRIIFIIVGLAVELMKIIFFPHYWWMYYNSMKNTLSQHLPL
jgi:uncharacterized membrane protein YuzA (DUF378 family)